MAKATFEVISSTDHTDEEYDFLPLHIILKKDLVLCFLVFWSQREHGLSVPPASPATGRTPADFILVLKVLFCRTT